MTRQDQIESCTEQLRNVQNICIDIKRTLAKLTEDPSQQKVEKTPPKATVTRLPGNGNGKVTVSFD